MTDLVSVIIPAYRAESTIAAAVASVLAQTHTELEVIVVDDGSPDATGARAIAAAAGDPRFRLISQANGGVSVARNTALDAARGTWIALLDADDTFDLVRTERLLARAYSQAADLIADNVSIHVGREPKRAAFPDDRMRAAGYIGVADFIDTDRPRRGLSSSGFIKPMIRRAFVGRHGLRYRPGSNVGEDFDFVLRALLCGARLTYTPDAYYNYMVQERSLSRGDEGRFFVEFQAISRNLIDEAIERNRADVAKALMDRERDTWRWFTSLEFERCLDRRDALGAVRSFARLPSKSHGLYLTAAKLRRIALRR